MNPFDYPKSAPEYVDWLRAQVEEALAEQVPVKEPRLLYEPARYVLSGGGKRLRPVLLLLTAESYGVPALKAMPAALSVEVFHNFTLVHDDIMDNAATRRGKPTVHTRWDAGTAILSGDYLMGLSYDLLTAADPDRVGEMLQVYHRMVRLLCEGQAMDKAFETRSDVTVEAYIAMIDRKTAALLEAVFELGGILGGADVPARDKLRLLGRSVGRAFQIQDDLLDITAQNQKWGKKVGGDLIEGKKTYLLLRALEASTEHVRSFFEKIVMHNGLPEDKIPEARKLLEENGILEDARNAVLGYTGTAIECLHALPASHAAEALSWLINEMQDRMH